MYAIVYIRLDIAYIVGAVSRYLINPGREYWQATKWILRCVRGTSNACLCYMSDKLLLIGYTNANMAGNLIIRRSTLGIVINFAGGVVSWSSRLQKCVTLSTTKAKFITTTETYKEIL